MHHIGVAGQPILAATSVRFIGTTSSANSNPLSSPFTIWRSSVWVDFWVPTISPNWQELSDFWLAGPRCWKQFMVASVLGLGHQLRALVPVFTTVVSSSLQHSSLRPLIGSPSDQDYEDPGMLLAGPGKHQLP